MPDGSRWKASGATCYFSKISTVCVLTVKDLRILKIASYSLNGTNVGQFRNTARLFKYRLGSGTMVDQRHLSRTSGTCVVPWRKL